MKNKENNELDRIKLKKMRKMIRKATIQEKKKSHI